MAFILTLMEQSIHQSLILRYEGNWKDDRQHGFGKEVWPDGAKFEGDYLEGLKHGKGTLTFADGAFYRGEFVNNDIDGSGTYQWNDGRKYDGQWKHNKMHGWGNLQFLYQESFPGPMGVLTRESTRTTKRMESAASLGPTKENI